MTMEDITALKEFDRQKDDFLAAVAHDLRNPLMIVAGSAQLLQRRARQLTGPDSEIEVFVDLARSMIRTTRRATSIVDELLDLTRMQMQRPILLDRSFFDLSALVQDAVDELARTTDRHEIHYTGASAFGWWDRGRLHRVVSNLVENAVKYSPDGGVVEVRVTAVDDGAWAELSIVDSGIGIPPDELPSIFKKFYRASNVDGSIDGSGIGLTVAQQITEAHGGALSIESTQGRGTTVSMRLPGVSGER
jgi:signal transduction histidine kinase